MEESDDKTTIASNNIDYGRSSISKLQNQEPIMRQASENSSSICKVNLAAALHDHSYDHSYDHMSFDKPQFDHCRNDDGPFTMSLNSTSCRHQQRGIIEENEFTSFADGQDDTFKDIILVQLDLIQHQQEQLLKKERQLQSARHDCEALYKRVESMEREMMNLKEQLTKKEENRQRNNENSTYLELNKDQDELDNQLTFCNFLTDPSNLLTTSSNVYQSNDQFHLNKSPLSSIHQSPKQPASTRSNDEIEQSEVNNIKFNQIDDNRKRKKVKPSDELKDDKKLISTTAKKKSSNGGGKKVNDKLTIVNSKKSSDRHKSSQSNNLTIIEPTIDQQQTVQVPIKTLETDYPYEIVTNKDFFNSLEDDVTETKSNQQSNIEIPSWRVFPISCSYSLEGTECLHDEMFSRRHSKLELDEKRRKRWEMQRLRELKNNERLRSGRYSSKQIVAGNNANSTTSSTSQFTNNDNSNDMTSFYPAPNILKYIEITDKLPLVAFGQPIPDLDLKKPNNFQLPWNKTTKSGKGSKLTKKS